VNIYFRDNSMSDFFVVIIFIVFLLISGCASQENSDTTTQPDWVIGSSQKYNAAQYYLGKGQAPALDVATKNARIALVDSLPDLTGNTPLAALDTFVQQAEVMDVWHDNETRQHHVLVVLERTAITDMLREQLTMLDARTRQLIDSATQGMAPLLQIKAIHDALATQQPRADLLRALRVLGVDVLADAAVWSVIEMQVHLKSLLSSIDVAPRVSADSQLGSAVVRALDAAGYLSKRAQPSYVLNTTLQRSGMKWEQGRFVENGTLSVELIDRQQQVVGKAQWPLRAQAWERAMLEKELMNEVTNTLREEMAETVLGLQAKQEQE